MGGSQGRSPPDPAAPLPSMCSHTQKSSEREKQSENPLGNPLALLCSVPTSSCSSGFCSSGASSSTAGGMLLLMLNVTVILQRTRKS